MKRDVFMCEWHTTDDPDPHNDGEMLLLGCTDWTPLEVDIITADTIWAKLQETHFKNDLCVSQNDISRWLSEGAGDALDVASFRNYVDIEEMPKGCETFVRIIAGKSEALGSTRHLVEIGVPVQIPLFEMEDC